MVAPAPGLLAGSSVGRRGCQVVVDVVVAVGRVVVAFAVSRAAPSGHAERKSGLSCLAGDDVRVDVQLALHAPLDAPNEHETQENEDSHHQEEACSVDGLNGHWRRDRHCSRNGRHWWQVSRHTRCRSRRIIDGRRWHCRWRQVRLRRQSHWGHYRRGDWHCRYRGDRHRWWCRYCDRNRRRRGHSDRRYNRLSRDRYSNRNRDSLRRRRRHCSSDNWWSWWELWLTCSYCCGNILEAFFHCCSGVSAEGLKDVFQNRGIPFV